MPCPTPGEILRELLTKSAHHPHGIKVRLEGGIVWPGERDFGRLRCAFILEATQMDKKVYLSIMAAVATAAVLWLLALLVAPFSKPLLWALVIGVATMPHYDRITGKFPHHPNRNAGIMVLLITLCVVLPISLLLVAITQNAIDLYGESTALIAALTKTGPESISNWPLGRVIVVWGNKLGLNLADYPANFASSASQFLLEMATGAVKNLADFFFTLVMTLFILFFIYRDGEVIISAGISRFAANRGKAFRYSAQIRSTTTAVVVGTILTCLAQGVLAGIGYLLAGLPAPALCGALTAFLGLVPVVGTGLIWVPLALFLAFTGAFYQAGFLVLWCLIIVVFVADNAIRPLAIGAKSDIPVAAIILGAVGGVAALGLLGLIVGPIFFGILTTSWREATGAEPTSGVAESAADVSSPG